VVSRIWVPGLPIEPFDDKFDEEVIDSKEIMEDFAIRWLDARDDID
jgi:hypothetical protein